MYKCIEFLHENDQQRAYTVVYNDIIRCCIIFQQCTQYNDTTACVNWPMKKCQHENYQQRAYTVACNDITACVNWSIILVIALNYVFYGICS